MISLCWIDFRLKLGTTTLSGSVPFATPYSAAPSFVIAADAIEPTLLPPPSLISADTLTAGATCAESGFVKANVTSHAENPDAAVNTSCPDACVHVPLVPSRPDVEDTLKLALSSVCDPVSPVMVTVDPAARSKSAVSATVNVLVAPDAGVLCPIDVTVKLGTTTVSGSAPLATPYSAVPGFAIAADAIVAEPDAAMLIAGDDCAVPGFVIWNRNV